MTCRKRMNDVKTGVESLLRDQRWGDPLTASAASGIKVARVRFWLEHGTWEPVASMPREKPKWRSHKGLSTDAGHRGGWACSSVEVPVMGMERRGPITQLRRGVNQAIGRNPAGRRGLWPGDKSRMSREAPVRFREGLGVKFPRATRLNNQERFPLPCNLQTGLDPIRRSRPASSIVAHEGSDAPLIKDWPGRGVCKLQR
jgi:hypothetical protein